MHHQVIGTGAMASEGHVSPDPDAFGSSAGASDGGWVDMSQYNHHTAMPDYGANYGFGMAPVSHGLPSDSIMSRMAPPPLPQTPRPVQHQHPHQHQHQQQHQGHPLLHPLIMPSNPTWPSQLTNPGNLSQPTSYSAPAVTMPPPLGVQLKTSKVSGPHTQSTPRKTLNNEIRREMCKFAEENPLLKQTEIGSRFGVERSTVSKVLRNKDKYLNPDDRVESPVKRASKGKTVDIEKALTVWFRNRLNEGSPVTNQDIRNQARFFSQTASGPSDTLLKQISSSSWLEKFKQKNGMTSGPKLLRRASETNISHSSSASIGMAGVGSNLSPASPPSNAQPSPLSANPGKSDDDEGGGGSLMDFTPDSDLRPTTFTFSPDPNVGGGFLDDPTRNGMPGGPNFQRPRSQTFPTLDIELMNQPRAEESLSPKYNPVPSTAPSSALESPMSEMLAQPFAIDTSVTSPHLHRSSSSSSLAPRSSGTPVATSAALASTSIGSSPNSPTQEDARRAADTLLSFIQQNAGSLIDQNDYNYVVRLTEKLRLHQPQFAKGINAPQGMMGGLSRIPEGEVEMANAPSLPGSMSMVKAESATMAS